MNALRHEAMACWNLFPLSWSLVAPPATCGSTASVAMFVCPQRIQGTRQVCKERSQSLLHSNYVWSLRRVARCYVETRLGVLTCESDAAPSATTLVSKGNMLF